MNPNEHIEAHPPADLSDDAVVWVVDDDAAIRRSLRRLLEMEGFRVETFDGGEGVLRHSLPLTPCCILLDLRMPDVDGLQVIHSLCEMKRRPSIVFITADADVASSVTAMKAGAIDFLEKPFQDAELLEAVAQALARDRKQLTQMAEHEVAQAAYARLSDRERQVLRFVVQGTANKVTASRLEISEKTVKVHRARIFEKFGATSLVDLVVAVGRLGDLQDGGG